MKQLYLRITCLLLLIFSIGSITAQTCSSTFTVSTTSTPSTCQANGTITVTLDGDVTNLSNVQYGLTTSAGAAVINPQENNVLTNIPAGSYTVSVRAFCKVDENYNVVKTVANVVVGGNYKVPSASFNAGSSRKSYSTCNTGIIALNVTDGSGTFTFNITSAPAGVTLGEVVPTKSGTLYTFPTQDYPAGNYSVQIQDGCYTSVATFTLGQITGFPPIAITNTSFYPTLIDGDCSSVKVYPGTVSSSDPDFYRYYTDGMYEIGITKAGAAMPTNWYSWKPGSASPYVLDLSPYSLSDFYASNSMIVYLRIKGCPNSYITSLTNLRSPYGTTSSTRRCDDYLFYYRPYTDYDGNLCYPLSVVITQKTNPGAGTVIYSGSLPAASASSYSSIVLQYGVGYGIQMTDAAGRALPEITPNMSRSNMSLSYSDVPCSTTYNLTYSSYEPCYPIDVTITEVATGTVIYTNRLTSSSTSAITALEYGKSYRFDAVYVGTDPLRSYTYTIPIRNINQPTAYRVLIDSPNSCIEDYGRLYIASVDGTYFPAGTTMTVTGPAGYTTQTYTATSQAYYYYFPSTTLPAGTYTLTVNSTCPGALPITTVVNLPGIYSGKNLAYTTQNTCEGTKIFPTGSMTYQGNNTTTYYRLTNGPAGYDKTVIGPGGSFTLSAPGTYTLGILNTNSATGCVINTKTIVYTAPPLALDNTGTSAYTCVDDVTGIIIVKGTNGVAPYTYQLWDEANTTKLVATDLVSSDRAIFNYGEAGKTYTVRVKDNCGNEFSQKVTLARLKTARIVNADPSSVCTGETIVLKCTTLGTTAYTWTGPNGYTSTAQNPTIPNATADMTGWYKVSVMPEFCGEAVKDSAYVTVYPPLTAGAVTAQAVCVRTAASALSGAITGGSGTYTYQWQTSLDGSTGWTDISGATAANYTPPVKIQSGANYYRVVVTDRCGTVNGNPITVNSTPCYIPVNPSIRSESKK